MSGKLAWWARTAACCAAVALFFNTAPHPHTVAGWAAYDAIGVAVGVAGAGLFEATLWSYRQASGKTKR